ncbi:hypothetical protein GALMADRAFT_245372 [Galerina marginata CBS 339.88]|uniref:Zinc finger Mcm10/DnaG-type domain-containing protein n=1 Tax=Galerina marginata (strain CBS 339.88) TaxID=685588 RepID=A0A067T7D4_GALM3|nr:hypothetical protein GALMADRAFT_245372 [Galerina marginata CBS 339.88]
MNSSTSRTNAKRQSQEEIKRQIALLQACLDPEEIAAPRSKSPKRKAPEPVTLAPATPSPKKKRKLDSHQSLGKPLGRLIFQTVPQQNTKAGSSKPPEEQFKKPAPSNFLNKLATVNRKNDPNDVVDPISRSMGFTEKPKEIQPLEEEHLSHKRDERLALVEDLEPGPYEHTPPYDDPNFEKLEPHSGINMISRIIPHEEFKDYLRGRYYLSPSRLYSAIRPLDNKQGYDVPVPGDWITIAVVAERGPIKFTRAPVAIEREDGDPDPRKRWKGKSKGGHNEFEKPSGKKYVNLKLIDFGSRSGSFPSATGGVSTIRGDAFLTLLLFESDGFDVMPREDGRKPDKLYRGGSRGAFENLTSVKEGDIIALLNPKILKPFQRSSDSPHPVNNILALTPESASSIIVLGRAQDLGMCTVRKQDGKVCGSWCDKRLSDVCDYHLQNAVKSRRAARPEFSVGTSGMSTSSAHKSRSGYDPLRKWGLKPTEDNGPGATYVVSGHVVTGSSSDPRTMYVAETVGREGQAKAKRRLDAKDSDRALKALLQRDKEGMKAVMKARETSREVRRDAKDGKKAKDTSEKAKLKRKSAKLKGLSESSDEGDDDQQGKGESVRKQGYSAGVIKSLGFDPSLKPGQRRSETKGVQNKLEALELVRMARKDIALGPKPGPRIRSGVMAPKQDKDLTLVEDGQDVADNSDTGGSDDELPEGVMQVDLSVEETEEKMIDLDDF